MDENAKAVLELVDEKHDIILEILEKTKQQSLALKEQEIEQLNDITDSKQKLIDLFDQKNDAFAQKFNAVKSQAEHDTQFVASVKEKLRQITQVMDKIYELELANKNALTKQMDEMKKNIQQTNQEKKGLRAYFHKGFQGSSYIDRKN
jgi:uncharacterized coiled-coil protein SlyX